LPLALRAHHFVDEQQEPARLRWQLVERAAQHFMRDAIGRRDILLRDFDVRELLAAVHHRPSWPLVLVQERDGADQREIFM